MSLGADRGGEPAGVNRRRAYRVSVPVVLVLCVAAAGSIEMERIATVPLNRLLMARAQGFDLDHDGMREFVLRRGSPWLLVEIYESAGDSVFTLAHSLTLPGGTQNGAFALPLDAGDADGDGLSDLVVYGAILTRHLRIYESVTPDGYPTATPVWESPGWNGQLIGGKIADTDRDGKSEIVFSGYAPGFVEVALAVFENTGDNSYEQIYNLTLPGEFQTLEVMNDLDQDGRDEIVFCRTGICRMVEATGDDTFQEVWSGTLIHTDGQAVNPEVLEEGGDLDGDGKREFLVGGLKTISAGSDPFINLLYLFESTADNTYQVVTTFTRPVNLESPIRATIADVDGDGKREIVFALQTGVSIYKNTGDNAWKEVWLGTTVHVTNFSLVAGDHDGDGKEEILFKEANNTTGIFEIDPLDAVDTDTDGVVDVIDNCPAQANSGQQDADGDQVGDVCDTCADTPNPAQGPAALGQTLLATNAQAFDWATPVDVLYARGPLSAVGTYTTDVVQALPHASALSDAAQPGAGSGFFYLVRPDCPAGSWQSTVGAEPGRDLVLP